MDSISFKARYIDNAFVQVKRSKQAPLLKEVPILKASKNDKVALIETCKKWAKKNNLARILLNNIDGVFQTDNCDIYIATLQEENFRKLVPERILGIAEVSKHNEFWQINYMQANPKFEYKNKKRKITDSGKAIVDYITNKANKRKTYVDALDAAVNFYKKCGFKIVGDSDFVPLMVYDPNDSDK